MKWLLAVPLISVACILAFAPAPEYVLTPRDQALTFLLTPETSAAEFERSLQRAAAYERWRWFDRYDDFARAHNLFADAVMALLDERKQGIVDARFTHARAVEGRWAEVERRWGAWRDCEGWPEGRR